MLLEVHTHTSRHSACSIIAPAALIKRVVRKGIQGIILTEHHYLWTDDEMALLRAEAEAERNFLILAGQEVETDVGHVLVYGAGRTIPGPLSLKALRERVPSAALVWAHPFRNGRIPSASDLTSPLLDGIEMISLNQSMEENYRGLSQWHALKFTGLSGSDTHSENMAGVYHTQFDHPIASIEDVVAEIRHGRCRPFLKEIPKAGSDLIVTEVTLGTKGDDELRNRIIVKKITDEAKWARARESSRIIGTLYEQGFNRSLLRVPRVIDVVEKEHLVIEEGQRGKNLFDLIATVRPETGARYVELAAQWLAGLHAQKLRVTDAGGVREKELKRFARYEESFAHTHNPYANDILTVIEFVRTKEQELFEREGARFVQLHGDYHPKNIIIGHDRTHDPSTLFVSVIDFNNSLVFSPAFDVGYFLAQFKSQFCALPQVLKDYPEDIFLNAYLSHAGSTEPSFGARVDLFKMRAYLSIANFFIKVGKGESREMETLVRDSLQLLS